MKINLRVLAFVIIFFSLLETDYLSSIEIIHSFFIVMRVVTLFLAVMYFLLKKQLPKITLIVLLYFIIYAITTYINSGNLLHLFSYSVYIISFIAWLEIALKNYPIQGLQSLNFVYSALVYINVIFFILFPNGYMQVITGTGSLVNRYFLGVYNQFAATLIPAVIINVVYTYLRFGKLNIRSLILIGAVLFTFIYFWSATSITGISLIILYLIFIRKSILNKFINTKIIITSVISLYILLVGLENIGVFSFIIEDILNRDVTLSTRTIIWDASIEMIKESPYYGYGYLGDGGRYIVFSAVRQRDAHNTILQYMLQHGIIGFIPLIMLLLLFIRNIAKINRHQMSKFVLFSFFVATTMMISEVYSFTYILVVLILGIFIPNIIESINNKGQTLGKSHN